MPYKPYVPPPVTRMVSPEQQAANQARQLLAEQQRQTAALQQMARQSQRTPMENLAHNPTLQMLGAYEGYRAIRNHQLAQQRQQQAVESSWCVECDRPIAGRYVPAEGGGNFYYPPCPHYDDAMATALPPAPLTEKQQKCQRAMAEQQRRTAMRKEATRGMTWRQQKAYHRSLLTENQLRCRKILGRIFFGFYGVLGVVVGGGFLLGILPLH